MSDITSGGPSVVPGSPSSVAGAPGEIPGSNSAILPIQSRTPSTSELVHTKAGLIDMYWEGISQLESSGVSYANWLNEVRNLLVDKLAVQMEDYAQANAPWQDQTGDARAGLHTTVEHGETESSVTLAHSVSYGVYLETKDGGTFAIILPTILTFASQIAEIERETASSVRVERRY